MTRGNIKFRASYSFKYWIMHFRINLNWEFDLKNLRKINKSQEIFSASNPDISFHTTYNKRLT